MSDRPTERDRDGGEQSRISTLQLRAALTALGFGPLIDDDTGPPITRGVLLGCLLAVLEYTVRDDGVGDDADAHLRTGYRLTLDALADHDAPTAVRAWAVLVQDRLHRTAMELNSEHGCRELVQVACPAVLTASNLLSLLHHTAASPDLIVAAVTTTGVNLSAATDGLDQLRASLRRSGYDL